MASKNKNDDTKITETVLPKITIDDQKLKNEQVEKALKMQTVEVIPAEAVKPANNGTEEQQKVNKETVGVKPHKRSPDSEDVDMAPPTKVSRILESKDNDKVILKIENIPGTFEETSKIIKLHLETEFGADSDLDLKKEQADKQTNILLEIQNYEDAEAVFEKLQSFKIDGNLLSVKKYYNIPKVGPVDLFDEEYKGTYGLSEDFLEELGIKTPLTKWIHVSNTNCQRNILMELMEYAGKVLYCNVTHTKTPYAKIMFSHPLEAVQAISLFNNQTFYGRLLTVTMVQPPPNEGVLPKGVQKIGKGFGPDGTPLRDILKQFERYYNGEKFNINYSVLESEKHRVPVAKKLDIETEGGTKEVKKDEKNEAKKEEKKEVKKEEKTEEKTEDKKLEKIVDKKELPKRYVSVMTQTYALPSKLIQKMADLIKKGISVSNIDKVLDRLADDDDDDDVVVVVSNDKDKKLEKSTIKRERPRSVSPVAAKPAAKQPFKGPVKAPATPFRPQKPISTRFTTSPCNPVIPNKFNKPSFNNSSNSQQPNNNFGPNNNFNNNQQQPFNSGVNNMGGFDQGNHNQNMGMMQNMGQNMQMGQQNMGMGQQNMPMGQQNMAMRQQNMPMIQQNMPVHPNMSMAQQNMSMGQHNNMGPNNINPFALNQVVAMVQNAAGNLPVAQSGHMDLGQMGQGGQPIGNAGQMGQSGQMIQGGAMGQSGFQNQQVLLGQGTADFLVLVSNLPQSVTFKLLQEKMSTCGDVKFLKMTNPGCAVVGYGELWEAQRCVAAFNKTVVDGHTVEIRMM